ncbi:MAG: sensor histidine kinase [Oscillospiraceae bacterium]|nr:sensor histidine kinase [Oscillospiraceae bacterium]
MIAKKSKHPPARRIVSVVLSIILLWGFGISMLLVLLNLGIGFASETVDFNQSFLELVLDKEYMRITDYATVMLRMEYADDPNVFSSMLTSFRSRYDPEKTNLRFTVTDQDGRLVLSNVPENEQNEGHILASSVQTNDLLAASYSHRVQHHFSNPVSDYRQILSGDKTQYLEENDTFSLWYFSDYRVDEAYHQGLEAVIPEAERTALVLFQSAEEAEEFDYAGAFGAGCSWTLMNQKQESLQLTGGLADGGADIYVVQDGTLQKPEYGTPDYDPASTAVVRYRTDETALWLSLSEYYAMKNKGAEVRAADQNLEQVLTDGVDITIQAEHQEWTSCYFLLYLPAALSVDDRIRADYSVLSAVFSHSEAFSVALFVLMVLTVASCVVMCKEAGHVPDSDEIRASRIHSFPYEIFWLLPVIAFLGAATMLSVLFMLETQYRVTAVFCVGMLLCIAAACILWLYTTAVRVKTGTFWTSFGMFRFSRMILRLLFKNRAAVSVAALLYVMLLGAGNILFISSRTDAPWILLILLLDLLTLFALLYCIYAYFELRRHVRQIESGDLSAAEHPIPLKLDFAGFDRSLNSITDGVESIVEKQLKAEHLRTELITNVSHDLKTPLTSIVNYVDLLSREPMQSETAAEYLEVLRRQAARLKKLTIDLVDASKASTGNLTVELVPLNIQVLIGQITGEYEEQLHARGLTLMQSVPDEPLTVLADGRQIWRVFDNLLNNACKYAMAGTRVYLDVKADEKTVVTTLKNISAMPLNISPDELMERFVRGDSSRSTEGSGLGLSIARDLTVLQNGTLELSTDGDLFKVRLRFPRQIQQSDD